MNGEKILLHLKRPLPVVCFDSVPSTNEHAKALARQGAAHGTAVFADLQTRGRGRRGRCFLSPAGGLYMSLVVDQEDALPGHLTTLAAVAVARAVREVSGHELQIKWVNDLLYGDRKVCGILTEGVVLDGALSKSVVGIGVNTGPAPDVPGAGTIGQSGRPYDRERLAAFIINRILESLPLVSAHMDGYRALCRTVGQRVSFDLGGARKTGLASGVDDDGALLVKTGEGLLRLIAGEVSVLPG